MEGIFVPKAEYEDDATFYQIIQHRHKYKLFEKMKEAIAYLLCCVKNADILLVSDELWRRRPRLFMEELINLVETKYDMKQNICQKSPDHTELCLRVDGEDSRLKISCARGLLNTKGFGCNILLLHQMIYDPVTISQSEKDFLYEVLIPLACVGSKEIRILDVYASQQDQGGSKTTVQTWGAYLRDYVLHQEKAKVK